MLKDHWTAGGILACVCAAGCSLALAGMGGGYGAFYYAVLSAAALSLTARRLETRHPGAGRWAERLVPVLILSAAALMIAAGSRYGTGGFAWSDEWSYLVQARVIAATHQLTTHLYIAASVIEKGLPQADVHMPGNSLLIALAYALFGVSEGSSVLASRICYLLVPLLLYAMGRKLYGPSAGLAAALLFLSCPFFAFYANTAMNEMPCLLAAGLLLAAMVLLPPGWRKGAWMGSVFCVNLMFREFNGALLVPLVVWLFLETPALERRRTFTALAAALVSGALLLFWLSGLRGIDPVVSQLTGRGLSLGSKAAAVLGNFKANLGYAVSVRPDSGHDWMKVGYALVLLVPVLGARSFMARSRFAGATVLLWIVLLPLVLCFHHFYDWRSLRMTMYAMLPVFILCGAVLTAQKEGSTPAGRAVRWTAGIGLFLFLSWAGNMAARDLQEARGTDRLVFRVQEKCFDHAGKVPEQGTVLVPYGLSLGWTHYPLRVVWHGPEDPADLERLDRILPLDALYLPWRHPLLTRSGWDTPAHPRPDRGWRIGNFRYERESGIYRVFRRAVPARRSVERP